MTQLAAVTCWKEAVWGEAPPTLPGSAHPPLLLCWQLGRQGTNHGDVLCGAPWGAVPAAVLAALELPLGLTCLPDYNCSLMILLFFLSL